MGLPDFQVLQPSASQQTVCNGPSASASTTVTVTPTVGTPTAITIASGSEPNCQLTNGTTTTTYATTATNNTGFNWSLSNAAAGSINSSGVMTWTNGFSGSVNIQVTANGCNGPSAQVVRTVSITPTVGIPTAITVSSGTEPSCQVTNGTTTTTYATTATNNTGFNWSLSNAAAGSINTSGIMTWANGFTGTVDIQVTANGCNGPSALVKRTVTVSPTVGIPSTPTPSATTICQGSGTTTYTTLASDATSYNWSVSGAGNTISGTGTTGTVTWAPGFSGVATISVTANGCNGPSASASTTVTVTPTVGTPTAITIASGSDPNCQLTNGTTTTTYATTATNNTGFNWSLSNAAAGSINSSGVMTWVIGFSGSVNIQVTANGCNGPSAQVVRTVNITPTVGTPTAITVSSGTEPSCQVTSGTTTTTYATTATNNTGFNWSLSNAAAGSINSSGVMTWTNGFTGTVDIQVTANGCNGPSALVKRTVTVSPTVGIPSTPTPSATTICQGSGTTTYTTLASDATSYNWSVSGAGNTISGTGTTGTITWAPGFSGVATISVTANGCNGPSAPNTTTVTVNPTPSATISGTTSVCQNTTAPNVIFTNPMALPVTVTYNINGAPNQTTNIGANTTASVPAPTTTVGNFIYNLVSVQYQSAPSCSNPISGNATVTVRPEAPLQPGVVTGNNFVTPATSETYTISAVTNATSYIWAVPTGWTILSGQGTTSLTVKTGIAAQGGNITVKASNDCGDSPARIYAVSVNPDLTIVTHPVSQTDCYYNMIPFTVTISGGSPVIVYTWQRKRPSDPGFTDIVGDPDITYPTDGKMNVYQVGSASNPTGTQYRVVITDAVNANVTSNPATITVNRIATLTPVSIATTICAGGTASFSATTEGETPISYQWKKYPGGIVLVNGGSISGATTTTLTFTNATVADAGEYRLQVVFPTCTSTSTIYRDLVVNPLPTLSGPASVCVGKTINWTPAVGGTWTSSDPTKASITDAGLVTGIAVGTVTFTFKETATGCSSTSSSVTIYPIPDVAANPVSQTICSGSASSIALSSSVAGASFNWTVVQSGVSGASSGSGATIAQTLTATGNAPGTATYSITPIANGCDGSPISVVITVTPIPTVTDPSDLVVCNTANTSAINFTGAVAGTVFNWTNNKPSIGLAASGTGNIAAFAATNSGLLPVTATITVTPVFTNSGTTCTGTAQTFDITVNPTGQVDKPADVIVCNGSGTPAITFTTTNSGGTTTYSWTNDNSSIGLPILGTGNIASFIASNNGIAPKVSNLVVTPHFTNGGVTCDGPTQTFTITVNPTPIATATPASQIICSADITNIALTASVVGTTFSWTVADLPVGSITGAAAGNGNSIAQTLVNTTPNPATLTYTITPRVNGCDGAPIQVVITVNPKPVLSSSLTPPQICSNTLFSYLPTSATAGTTFSWTRAAILGITPNSGLGTNNPNETLVNLSSATINVTYVYTLTANGCTNVQNVIVPVLPDLTLSSLPSTTTCSNSLFTYIPTSLLPVSFDWSRAAVANISNAAASGTGTINETLINTSPVPVDVIYVYTLKIGSCVGTQSVQVTVKPSPTLTSSLTPPAICSNTAFVYTATSATAPITYSWYRPVVPGISNGAGAGATNLINETLTNTTPNPVTVRYEFTLRSAGCQNLQYVDVVVNPTPTLSSSPSANICTNSLFNYTPTSATTGTTFAWTRALVAGISNAAVTTPQVGNISETLINTSGAPVTVTYMYTLTANGCTNTQNVTVVVNPLPTIAVTPVNPQVCLGSSTALTASGANTYSWTIPPSVAIIGSAATLTVSPVVNTTYKVTGTDANGCVNSTTVLVTVLPKPIVNVSAGVTICNGNSTTLTASSPDLGLTYSWSPSTGLSATTGNVVTASPTSTRTYTVTGTDANGCTNTATVTVTVNPPPTITITPSSSTICSGSSTTLTAGGAVSYVWNDGASDFSTDPTIMVSPLATTTYTVTGTNANGCIGTRTVTVTIRPLPILTNANPPDLCSSHLFTFNPTPSIAGTTWTWTRAAVSGISPATSNGSGNISETLNSSNATSTTVIYEFTLTAPTGCINTVTVPVLVVPAPAVTVTASSNSLCATQSFNLTSSIPQPTQTFTLLSPNFNAATNNWTENPTSGTQAWNLRANGYYYNAPGPGGVTFYSNDNSQFYLVNSQEVGGTNFTSTLQSPQFSTSGYTGATMTFYHYFRDDGGSDQAIVQWSANGTSGWTDLESYSSTEGSANGFVQQVVALPVGKSSIYVRFYYQANDAYYWAIDNVTITGEIAPTVVWSSSPVNPTFGNPTTANVNNVTQTQTTTYTASYTYPGFSCPGQASITITTLPSPIIPNQTVAGICSGGSFTVTPVDGDPGTTVPPGTKYTWSAPSISPAGSITGGSAQATGQTSISQTLINTTGSNATATYTVTATTPGVPSCTGTFIVTVTVYPSPVVNNIANIGPVCNGNTAAAITFGSNVAGSNYDWTSTIDVGFGTSGSGNIAAYTYSNDTNSPVVATVSVTATANGCTGLPKTFTITVNPNPTPVIDADYCAIPGKIHLTVTGISGVNTFLWSNGMTGNPIDVDIASGYSVTVTNSYGCTAMALIPVSTELVINGNFTNTNLVNPAVDFTTGYVYKRDQPGLVPAGQGELWDDSGNNGYSITTDGQNVHANFYGRDHTNNSTGSRNFMAVNGHGTITVWEQTVNVLPNTTYYYSAWGMNLNPTSPARLQFRVNGTNIGTIADLNVADKPTNNGMVNLNNWVRFYYGATSGWFSGANTTATIRIVDLNANLGGNDFGLDDISFGTLDPVTGTINPSVFGPVCMNGDLNLRANKTSTKPPFTYTWTGPAGFTSTDENPVIPNITAANSGTYNLTFTDGYGCSTLYGSVNVTVKDLPVCSITGPSATIPNATDNFTTPAGMTTYAWTIAGTGTISGASNAATVTVKAGNTCSGSYTLSLTVTNSNGCSSTCTQVVNMNDTSKPVVTGTLAPQIFEGCSATVSTPVTTVAALEAMGVTINDAFTPDNLLVVTSSDVTSGSCPITITRIYTVTDACGNFENLTQIITIKDTTKPVVTGTPTTITVQGCSVADVPAAATTVADLLTLGVTSVFDACTPNASLTVTSSDASSGTCPVVVTRTYTIKDACNNPVTVIHTIRIQDTILPTWTTAAGAMNVTLQCSDVAGLTAAQAMAPPSATDACSGVQAPVKTSGAFVSGGLCSKAGTFTNTWKVKDACGNFAATDYTQIITIIDDTKPTWTTPATSQNKYLECSDAAGIAAAISLNPVATDNCTGAVVVTKTLVGGFVPSGTCPQAGTYTYSSVATDACGNVSAPFIQLITLEDNTPPIITVPPADVILCSSSTLPSFTGTASVTDNCTPSVYFSLATGTLSYTDVSTPGTCGGAAKIVRTWKATDACGNSSTATQNIFTQDITPPTITTPAQNASIACGPLSAGALTTWLGANGNAVATDDCGTVTWTNNFTALATSCGGTTVIFTATDGCGNKITTQGTFTITDNQAPVITCPANVNGVLDNGQCVASGIVLGNATATDNCTPAASIVVTNNAPSKFPVGVTTVVWTATDACGNQANCSQLVTIVDNNQPPVFTYCPPDQVQTINGGCSLSNILLPDPTFTDNCPGVKLTWVLSGATSGSSLATGVNYASGQTFNVGITTVTYTLTDATNISITCSFKVWIKNLTPQFTVNCSTATNVTANAGAGICTANVTVPAPSISNPCNELFTMVNNSPYKTSLIDASGTYPIGMTTITWTITDASGNITNCTQTVTVTDTQAPTIACPANVTDFITNGSCTKVSGNFTPPVITDNCPNPVLTYSLVYPNSTTANGSGSVSSLAFPAGVTTVTYTVTDAGGLTASCPFTVTIQNLSSPTLSVDCSTATNVSQNVDAGLCTANVIVPAPKINNPCNEVYTQTWVMSGATTANSPATGVNNVSTYTFNFGLTTITWTITDASGNISHCTQTVTVTGTAPALSCPSDISVFADFMQQYKDIVVVPPPTYSVTCGVPTVTWAMTYPAGDPRPNPASAAAGINLVPSPSRFYIGVTSITYKVADINGNSTSCTFTVTVLAKPDITCLPPVSYVTDAGKCYHTVQAADADNPGVPTLNSGSQPIVWTWTITNPDATTATGTSTTTLISPIPTKIGPYNFQRGVSTIKWRAENPSGFYECTQTVTVNDIAPTFTLPAAISECVMPIQQAVYDPANVVTDNYSPNRPDYYLFKAGSTNLDLINLVFNCCATIHWTINFADGSSLTRTGQPSTYGSDIIFPGDGVTYVDKVHTISYQVADCDGVLTPVQQVNITIKPRPNLIKVP